MPCYGRPVFIRVMNLLRQSRFAVLMLCVLIALTLWGGLAKGLLHAASGDGNAGRGASISLQLEQALQSQLDGILAQQGALFRADKVRGDKARSDRAQRHDDKSDEPHYQLLTDWALPHVLLLLSGLLLLHCLFHPKRNFRERFSHVDRRLETRRHQQFRFCQRRRLLPAA